MRQSIELFRTHLSQFSATADVVKASWQDNIGDAFYRDIIQPLKQESAEMVATMQGLPPVLEHIKSQIDAI